MKFERDMKFELLLKIYFRYVRNIYVFDKCKYRLHTFICKHETSINKYVPRLLSRVILFSDAMKPMHMLYQGSSHEGTGLLMNRPVQAPPKAWSNRLKGYHKGRFGTTRHQFALGILCWSRWPSAGIKATSGRTGHRHPSLRVSQYSA